MAQMLIRGFLKIPTLKQIVLIRHRALVHLARKTQLLGLLDLVVSQAKLGIIQDLGLDQKEILSFYLLSLPLVVLL